MTDLPPTLHHGARSTAVVARHARNEKRRFLRQTGLRIADLDGIALGYLDGWARAAAKVRLMDAWIQEHGLLDEDGNVPGFLPVYFTALNSARLSLARLEGHLPKRDEFEDGLQGLIEQGRATRLQRDEEEQADA
jgi:hypothetical protein